MTDIKILYDKIYSENLIRDPKQFIDLYEENKYLIEEAETLISNPDYDGLMRITSEYALSLSQYGSSQKAIPYLDKSIQLFKDSSFDDLRKISLYERLVWTRGVENYNLRKYSLAAKDFQYLVYNYPDNDKYRNWLLASKTIKVKKISNNIWFVVFICIVWESLLKKENTNLKLGLFITACFLLVIAIIIEVFSFLVKAKLKNSQRTKII